MSKSGAHNKLADKNAATRSNVTVVEPQNSLGAHVCIQREVSGLGVQPQGPALVREVLNSPGQPLDAGARALMEPQFGYDFSGVRVHTDDKAAESARAVSALAYTTGSHIVLGEGQHSVATPSGRQLMAHELTHVVQQCSGPVAGTPIANGLSISQPTDPFERVADGVAKGELPIDVIRENIGPADTGYDTTIQRIMTPAKQPGPQVPPNTAPVTNPPKPLPNALYPTPLAQEVWEGIETRITPEIGIDFLEIGRVVAVDVKQQLQDLFAPYDASITDANQKFASYVGIALAGAGNVPQDPGPSNPNEKSPTYSITGGLGGALAQAGQVVVGNILDTGNVGVAKERAKLDAEALLGDKLTTDSPVYESFEQQAITEVRQKAELDWTKLQETFPPEILPKPSPSTYVHYVRREFGVHSRRVKEVIKGFQNILDKYLDALKKRLEVMKETAKRRRSKAGAIGGMFAGGIIGGAIGLGAGGGLGAAVGLIVGAAGGGILGGLGGDLFNATQGKPEEKNRAEEERAEDRKQLRTSGSEEDEEEKKVEPVAHTESPEREP